MIQNLNVVIAHGSDDTLEAVAAAIRTSHNIVARCSTIVELKSAITVDKPDVVVTGIVFPDGDGLETMIEVGEIEPCASVIVTARRSMELVNKAMEDHVMAYLIEPVVAEDLKAAIVVAYTRFEQLRILTEQIGDLKQALQDRKVIERAKGILMGENEMTEGQAFEQLRRAAQDNRMKLVEAAKQVLDTSSEKNT